MTSFPPKFETVRPFITGMVGVFLLLLLWQGTVDLFSLGRGTVPSPLQIARQFETDGLSFYMAGALQTLYAAVQGYFWGNLLAITLAMLVLALPMIEKPVLQLGVVSYCMPIVAIGPVLVIIFNGSTPRIILSALSVFFITLVNFLGGLRSVNRPLLDSIHAFGGGGLAKLAKARWRAALPNLFAALRVAAPAAILGAIVGEFLGAESGLGVVLINSQQALNFPRTWAVAVFTTAIAGLAYVVIGWVGNWMTPWMRETHANLAGETAERTAAKTRAPRLWAALRVAGSTLFSVGIVFSAWILILKVFQVSPFIGKGPLDVWAYIFDPDQGADNRTLLLSESAISLRDAFLGLASGTGCALVVATIFNLLPPARQVFMGSALALQSVPLVAMTPLVVLVFGRNLLAISVIGGIITFFPTLVNLTLALDRTPRDVIDLMRVFGSSKLATLMKVQIPNALPALFASLRVASPLALTGAMLAEWLATGKGLGYSISSDVATSDYSALWTRVALVTFYSLFFYNGIRFMERLVLNRMLDVRNG